MGSAVAGSMAGAAAAATDTIPPFPQEELAGTGTSSQDLWMREREGGRKREGERVGERREERERGRGREGGGERERGGRREERERTFQQETECRKRKRANLSPPHSLLFGL